MTRSARGGDLLISEYQALAEFRHQIRRFVRFSEETARESGLEPQQHQMMLAIRGLPNGHKPSIGALADRLQLRHHSTVELANRMEARGLIERIADSEDGRNVLLQLTAEGRNLLRGLSIAHREQLRTAGPELARVLRAAMRQQKASTAA